MIIRFKIKSIPRIGVVTGCGVAIELLGLNAPPPPLLTFSANIDKVYMYIGFKWVSKSITGTKSTNLFKFIQK